MSRHLVVPLVLAVLAAAATAPGQDKPSPAHGKRGGAIFKAPGSGTLGVALSPDGKILARAGTSPAFGPFGDTGHTVDLWDVASGKKLHTLTGHTETIITVAFSPDGKTLASSTSPLALGETRRELKLWDVATGKERWSRNNVSFGAFSPDGQTLATSHRPIKEADPHVVKLWDLATGKEKMELGVGASSPEGFAFSLAFLAFSPDGKTLAMSGGGSLKKPGSVQLWDLTTGKKRASMPGHDGADFSLGFTPDGKTLVSVCFLRSGEEGQEIDQQKFRVWDVATAKERATIAISGTAGLQVAPLTFTADGKTLITTAWIFEKDHSNAAGVLRIRLSVQHWDLATGKARATFWTPVNPMGNPFTIAGPGTWFSALSADGKTVAWGGCLEDKGPYTGTAHVWEVESLATMPPELFGTRSQAPLGNERTERTKLIQFYASFPAPRDRPAPACPLRPMFTSPNLRRFIIARSGSPTRPICRWWPPIR